MDLGGGSSIVSTTQWLRLSHGPRVNVSHKTVQTPSVGWVEPMVFLKIPWVPGILEAFVWGRGSNIASTAGNRNGSIIRIVVLCK